jgi:hypothetical protein
MTAKVSTRTNNTCIVGARVAAHAVRMEQPFARQPGMQNFIGVCSKIKDGGTAAC